MAENKTKPTSVAPEDYIAAIENDTQRQDAASLSEMMHRITGEPPTMWGPSIVGFGQYHYKYESGHEGDAMLAGFAARKANTVVYLVGNIPDQQALLDRLGKHKMGRACLYIKKLADVDENVLEALIAKSVAAQKAKYPD